jgi:peroxiredoxin
MRHRYLFITVTALTLSAGLMLWWMSPAATVPAPDVALTTLQGERIELRALRERPVLVNFWSISCASCVDEIPRLSDLYRELAPRGLEILAVAMRYDPPSHVIALSRGKRIPYPVALDPLGKTARAFGDVRVTPTSFLIAPDGRLIERHTGTLDIDRLRPRILELMQAHDSHPTRLAAN